MLPDVEMMEAALKRKSRPGPTQRRTARLTAADWALGQDAPAEALRDVLGALGLAGDQWSQ